MEELIKLAANTKSFGLKGNAQFKNILKNKNCGDEIKIEFDLKNKQISNFRYEGEVCIYCQASASLLSKNINRLNWDSLGLFKIQIEKFFNQINTKQALEIMDFKSLLNINNKNRKNCIVYLLMRY